ncbi:TIGR04438 family Trp-rich protein [uncultured Aquincola sp.]|uniref:TIGR04438 family Trp-rich protein n=1 Tax=uncultured Aquincola sp. TaxID=886556 RepID=UPI0032B12C26
MWFVALGLLSIGLKLAALGPFAGLSWWWVLSPFVLALLWWGWADKYGYTQKKAMDRMEAKKARRRERHLQDMGLDTRHKPRK